MNESDSEKDNCFLSNIQVETSKKYVYMYITMACDPIIDLITRLVNPNLILQVQIQFDLQHCQLE